MKGGPSNEGAGYPARKGRRPMRRMSALLSALAFLTFGAAEVTFAPAALSAPTEEEPQPTWLPVIWRPGEFLLRDTRTSGPADRRILFGDPAQSEFPMMCDWDGDGVSTPGVVRGTRWFITNATTSGPAEVTFDFGEPGDHPLCADWQNDGTKPHGPETPGVARFTPEGRLHVFAKYTVGGGVADRDRVNVFACPMTLDLQVIPGGAFSDGSPWSGCHTGDTFWFSHDPTRTDTGPMVPADPVWQFGDPGDRAVGFPTAFRAPQLGVFRPSTGEWFVMGGNRSETQAHFSYGNPGDVALSWANG